MVVNTMQVPLGVIPENENTREGILKIMIELQKLVPNTEGTIMVQ